MSSSEGDHDEQHPPTKRQRRSGRVAVPVPNPTTTDDIEAVETVETIDLTSEHDHIPLPDAPIYLLRVRGIPEWGNQGLASVRLGDLVTGTIRWALVSNYMIDLAWLFSACPSLCNIIDGMVVVHGEPPSRAAVMQQVVQASGLQAKVTFHLPPFPPYGTHHTKAFLLQYDTGLRIIVFTANALYPDCNNKSQALFYQDFPLKDELSPTTSVFEKDLLEYIVELKFKIPVMQKIINVIRLHDFSAARVRLIASVPSGYQHFTGDRISSFGHLKLRKVLEEESVTGGGRVSVKF